jgi:Domain of unknown function (DUF4234)
MSAADTISAGNRGPLGKPRGIGFGILLYIVTIGLYGWYWAFKTQEEMKRRTGEGIGGVIGLVIWIVINPVSAFVIPSEVGQMYRRDGKPQPLTGWTGLWLFPFGVFIIPAIVWFVKVQGALNRYWEGAGSSQPVTPFPAPSPAAPPPESSSPE